MTMKKMLLDEYGGFLDVGILSHGFAPHMRDYDIVFEALWGKNEWADAKGTYRLRFSHCPEATTMTAVSDACWTEAWSDVFIDYSEWLAAGEPECFFWGQAVSCEARVPAGDGRCCSFGERRARETADFGLQSLDPRRRRLTPRPLNVQESHKNVLVFWGDQPQ